MSEDTHLVAAQLAAGLLAGDSVAAETLDVDAKVTRAMAIYRACLAAFPPPVAGSEPGIMGYYRNLVEKGRR